MRIACKLTPKEKRYIKIAIQWIYRVINAKRKIECRRDLICFSEKKTHTFFGYYDITPFNNNNQMLYLEVKENNASADIVLNDIDHNKRYLGKTLAWNWQQGCRLRWFPGSDSEIIYNYYEDKNYGAKVVSTEGEVIRKYSYPLYDIDYTGSLGLTLNFERLGYLRLGYGYTCNKYEGKDLENESIRIIDLKSDKVIDKIIYKQISEIMPTPCNLKNCYINHLSFSPEGDKFLFFWIEIVNSYHKASLLVYDINTKIIYSLETEEKVSHYVWLDNNEILCTSYMSPTECRYYIYNIKKRSKTDFCPQSLKEDGHPSVYNEDKILTDTYPDKNGYQYIYLVDKKKDTKQTLIKIYSKPVVEGEKRTDLHPRFNINKSYISFDSNKGDFREFYILKMK